MVVLVVLIAWWCDVRVCRRLVVCGGRWWGLVVRLIETHVCPVTNLAVGHDVGKKSDWRAVQTRYGTSSKAS